MSVSLETNIVTLRPVTGRLPQAALVGAVLAIIGNMLILFVGRGLGTEFLLEPPGGGGLEPLPFNPAVLGASIVPAIAAATLLYLLDRYTQRPYIYFWVIAAAILILSFQGPLNVLTDSPQTVIGLNAMHTWTALAIGGALTALAGEQS